MPRQGDRAIVVGESIHYGAARAQAVELRDVEQRRGQIQRVRAMRCGPHAQAAIHALAHRRGDRTMHQGHAGGMRAHIGTLNAVKKRDNPNHRLTRDRAGAQRIAFHGRGRLDARGGLGLALGLQRERGRLGREPAVTKCE